jgi:hypothetical protein
MAPPVLELPNLGEPVTFTGRDAERFLAKLPTALSPAEEARLRESVREAEASMKQGGAQADANGLLTAYRAERRSVVRSWTSTI